MPVKLGGGRGWQPAGLSGEQLPSPAHPGGKHLTAPSYSAASAFHHLRSAPPSSRPEGTRCPVPAHTPRPRRPPPPPASAAAHCDSAGGPAPGHAHLPAPPANGHSGEEAGASLTSQQAVSCPPDARPNGPSPPSLSIGWLVKPRFARWLSRTPAKPEDPPPCLPP